MLAKPSLFAVACSYAKSLKTLNVGEKRITKMKLNEIRLLVENSKPHDWYIHSEAKAVYISDIDVSLDWSETINANFTESWHQNFADTGASSLSVVLKNNGCTVTRWTFVAVDGGRYLTPLPKPANAIGYELPSDMMPLGNLMFGLFNSNGAIHTLTDLLNRCNITIV